MAAAVQSGGSEKAEIINRLREAVAQLVKLDEEAAGAVDLSFAIEQLRQAIPELELTH